MYSKYKTGKTKSIEYRNYLASVNGYKNFYEQRKCQLIEKGYKSISEYVLEGMHNRREHIPMDKNKTCPLYLGFWIAERILSCVFKDVKRMPSNNKGYDFICSKNYKIDVKSACLFNNRFWNFRIRKNKIADYFLLVAFDNRKDLNPIHLWLIKKDEYIHTLRGETKINDKDTLSIVTTKHYLDNYNKYEIVNKLEELQGCCNSIKSI